MDDELEDLQLNSDEGLNIKGQQQKFLNWGIDNKTGMYTFAIENVILNIQDQGTGMIIINSGALYTWASQHLLILIPHRVFC